MSSSKVIETVGALEAATEKLNRSVCRRRIVLLPALTAQVLKVRKRLEEATKGLAFDAPEWPRVGAAKSAAYETLNYSRRLAEEAQQRREIRLAHASRANGSTDASAPVAHGYWEFGDEDSMVLVATGADGCVHAG